MATYPDVGDVMTETLKGTANETGFEMAMASPLLEHFAAAYDGQHPLLDMGCAYGRNVCSALKLLPYDEDAKVKVIACDCAQEHLDAVDTLRIPEIRTVFGMLPSDLKEVQGIAAEVGGFSGILVSEVLHFLTGDAIEESIKNFKDLLAPGGRLCITMFSPYANISGRNCPVGAHWRRIFDERQQSGYKWPGEDINLKALVRELQASLSSDERAMACFPSYFHVVTAQQLKNALEPAGFQVLLAREDRHPGHAPHFHNDGRESTQLVAVKQMPRLPEAGA